METGGLDKAFVDYSCEKLQQNCERICVCLEKLNGDQIWFRGSENQNAVGNLVLHLCGNLRQWIGFGIGGQPDLRKRELEFSARGGAESRQLADKLREIVTDAVTIIRRLTPERLAQTTTVQGYEITVLQAVYHVVEHFAGHAGQIIFCTKQFTGEGLGFYTHLDSRRPHSEKSP